MLVHSYLATALVSATYGGKVTPAFLPLRVLIRSSHTSSHCLCFHEGAKVIQGSYHANSNSAYSRHWRLGLPRFLLHHPFCNLGRLDPRCGMKLVRASPGLTTTGGTLAFSNSLRFCWIRFPLICSRPPVGLPFSALFASSSSSALTRQGRTTAFWPRPSPNVSDTPRSQRAPSPTRTSIHLLRFASAHMC